MKTLLKTAGVLLGLLAAQSAHAITYSFYQLTNNATSVASQLSLNAQDLGTGFSLKFTNTAVIASNISEIYATDTKTFTAPVSITTSGSDVSFSAGGTPGSLSGSNNTLDILASANAPAAQNGVNAASEWVTLSYTYGGSFANFASLTSQLNSGSLQFGMHVTGVQGTSDAYITGGSVGPFPVPGVPDNGATFILLGGALLSLGFLRRRLV